jgi:hypothetical protein
VSLPVTRHYLNREAVSDKFVAYIKMISIPTHNDGQHHGSLHHHRRARRRSLADPAQVRDIVGVAFCARLNDSLQFEQSQPGR